LCSITAALDFAARLNRGLDPVTTQSDAAHSTEQGSLFIDIATIIAPTSRRPTNISLAAGREVSQEAIHTRATSWRFTFSRNPCDDEQRMFDAEHWRPLFPQRINTRVVETSELTID
jgi:hypothetical protein